MAGTTSPKIDQHRLAGLEDFLFPGEFMQKHRLSHFAFFISSESLQAKQVMGVL